MERLPAQALGWRLFAVFVALILAVLSLASPVLPPPGFTLEGAKTVYWLIAPIGLLGYAFGWRLFGVTFWKFYAVIFTVEITLRFLRLGPTLSSRPAWLVALVFLAIVMMCVALLRHANLIGGGRRDSRPEARLVRTRPAIAVSPPSAQRLPLDGARVLRLDYKRGPLIGTGLLLLSLAAVGALLALSPLEGGRGILRLLFTLLGPTGTQILVAATAIFLGVGAVRLIWLAFEGALAVQIGARGIRVRSLYFAGLLPWSYVRSVESRVVTGWGKHPVLVIRRTDSAGVLQRLAGLGDKIAVQRKFLDADDDTIAAWIEAARRGERSLQISNTAQSNAPHQRVFGRRQ